jgi:hypothetical protein
MREGFAVLARNAVILGELPPTPTSTPWRAVLFGTMPGYALQRLLVGHPPRATYLAGIRALLG